MVFRIWYEDKDWVQHSIVAPNIETARQVHDCLALKFKMLSGRP